MASSYPATQPFTVQPTHPLQPVAVPVAPYTGTFDKTAYRSMKLASKQKRWGSLDNDKLLYKFRKVSTKREKVRKEVWEIEHNINMIANLLRERGLTSHLGGFSNYVSPMPYAEQETGWRKMRFSMKQSGLKVHNNEKLVYKLQTNQVKRDKTLEKLAHLDDRYNSLEALLKARNLTYVTPIFATTATTTTTTTTHPTATY